MNRSNFVKQFRERFIAELQLKTGWGRNELIAKLDEILIDVLSDEERSDEERSLAIKLDQCLRVVREYVSSELADDPSQDDPNCELYPLIELVRNTIVK